MLVAANLAPKGFSHALKGGSRAREGTLQKNLFLHGVFKCVTVAVAFP